MKIQDIISDITTILGNTLSRIDQRNTDNGAYRCKTTSDTYVFGFIGASSRPNGRMFAQMQSTAKPVIIDAYEKSKQNGEKFFLIVPDSSAFVCNDYYVFIEMLDKGGPSSSFELNIPSGVPMDRISRFGKKSGGYYTYFTTFVPAKDNSGNTTTEYLKQYLFCFDSRPYSKYIARITDFLPSSPTHNDSTERARKDMWPNNFLIAGAPGTGKSYTLKESILKALKKEVFWKNRDKTIDYSEDEFNQVLNEIASTDAERMQILQALEKERVRRVTFYEDYTYENFVGCYKPVPAIKKDTISLSLKDYPTSGKDLEVTGEIKGNQVSYRYEAGPFINTLIDAYTHEEELYFLVIEEINRARAASVFGDMFQLLDRKDGVSEYAITPESALDRYLTAKLPTYDGTLKLPKNMYIWATMNNADQGVNPLDSAFKRRWGYLYIDVNSSDRDGNITIVKGKTVRWNIFRRYLNKKILSIAGEDKCIGAWYFKEEEFAQIEKYYAEDDRTEKKFMVNPLADKLLIYLMNDICRMNPSYLFKEGFTNMPDIREGLLSGIGVEDILEIEWDQVFIDNDAWIEANQN